MKNSIPVKVKNIIPYGNGFGCKGKLVFLKGNTNDIGIKYDPEFSRYGEFIKPIIISETENLEVGDKGLDLDTYFIFDFTGTYTTFRARKILAFHENFSPKHLQDIVDGKLKDGDEVFCECYDYIIEDEDWDDNIGAIPYKIEVKKIKLNSENNITLLPVKKEEEGWMDNFNDYCDYARKAELKMDSAVNYGVWLGENYNPPIRKK